MYEDIREQFKSVISFSQNIPNPNVDYLFREWEANKAKFIERFGGLIYEWSEPIEFTLDENQKRMRAMEFATTVSDTFNNPNLAEFIDENLDGFFENKVIKTCGEKGIPTGMKLLKAFKYFEPNKAALRSIQDMASNIIQENKIKGTLCFSVHPLDFLSSSENTYNWRSCHALDGEYRAGNLSYMVDKTTFMVYLKGADNQKLFGFGPVEWNSKKWRMLIHVAENDDIMFAGRQYPFSSKSGIDTVLNIYNNLMIAEKPFGYGTYKYSGWRADYVDSYVPYDATSMDVTYDLATRYLVYDNQLVDIRSIVKEGHNCLNYNDILKSTCYKYPYYAIFDPYSYHSLSHLLENPIVVGEEVPCLHCGDELISNPETMRCDDCELEYGTEENDVYSSCDCCGARIYVDDAICVGDDGDLICDACFHAHAFVCDCCGNVYYEADRVFVPDKNNEEDGAWYCRGCYEDMD
jgi:hypothetical protein